MAQSRYRTGNMAMNCRSAVTREIDVMRFAESTDLQESE